MRLYRTVFIKFYLFIYLFLLLLFHLTNSLCNYIETLYSYLCSRSLRLSTVIKLYAICNGKSAHISNRVNLSKFLLRFSFYINIILEFTIVRIKFFFFQKIQYLLLKKQDLS